MHTADNALSDLGHPGKPRHGHGHVHVQRYCKAARVEYRFFASRVRLHSKGKVWSALDNVQHASTQGRTKEEAMYVDMLFRTARVTAVFAMDVHLSLVLPSNRIGFTPPRRLCLIMLFATQSNVCECRAFLACLCRVACSINCQLEVFSCASSGWYGRHPIHNGRYGRLQED